MTMEEGNPQLDAAPTEETAFLDRRRFLRLSGGAVGLAVVASQLPGAGALAKSPKQYPFTLGVASGDPLPDGVVLWSRLAPDPLVPSGGMPPRRVPVQWQVATDEQFRSVVRRGTVVTLPEHAHSIHVDVRGLEPRREYFYRFKAGSEGSPVGRTRTAPPAGTIPARWAFAFASCQNFPAGYYAAYRDMAQQDLDLVVHLGDYIYEGPGDTGIRPHAPAKEIMSLEDYRVRHAQYKTDPHLQAAHAAFPWLVTWDDHEFDNNYSADDTDPNMEPAAMLARRAAAYQAYWEHMPLRLSQRPSGAHLPLYRELPMGDLVQFHVLDTRQYRSDQTNCSGEGITGGYCPSARDPNRTLLGGEQKQWLLEGLDRSPARWNVLAQQIIFAQKDNAPALDTQNYVGNGDQWDGYKADRDSILDFIQRRQPSNPVVITGDVHRSFVYDLKADFADTASPTIGTEFVGTSITSGGDPRAGFTTRYRGQPNDPHEVFYDDHRGYVRCSLTPKRWQADYRAVATSVLDPNAPVTTVASFVVEDGQPGAQPA